MLVMLNGTFRTEKAKELVGPALVTYVNGHSSMPVEATFERGRGLEKQRVPLKGGLYVPMGTRLVWAEDVIISFVQPREE
jgi:hypothetical protein